MQHSASQAGPSNPGRIRPKTASALRSSSSLASVDSLEAQLEPHSTDFKIVSNGVSRIVVSKKRCPVHLRFADAFKKRFEAIKSLVPRRASIRQLDVLAVLNEAQAYCVLFGEAAGTLSIHCADIADIVAVTWQRLIDLLEVAVSQLAKEREALRGRVTDAHKTVLAELKEQETLRAENRQLLEQLKVLDEGGRHRQEELRRMAEEERKRERQLAQARAEAAAAQRRERGVARALGRERALNVKLRAVIEEAGIDTEAVGRVMEALFPRRPDDDDDDGAAPAPAARQRPPAAHAADDHAAIERSAVELEAALNALAKGRKERERALARAGDLVGATAAIEAAVAREARAKARTELSHAAADVVLARAWAELRAEGAPGAGEEEGGLPPGYTVDPRLLFDLPGGEAGSPGPSPGPASPPPPEPAAAASPARVWRVWRAPPRIRRAAGAARSGAVPAELGAWTPRGTRREGEPEPPGGDQFALAEGPDEADDDDDGASEASRPSAAPGRPSRRTSLAPDAAANRRPSRAGLALPSPAARPLLSPASRPPLSPAGRPEPPASAAGLASPARSGGGGGGFGGMVALSRSQRRLAAPPPLDLDGADGEGASGRGADTSAPATERSVGGWPAAALPVDLSLPALEEWEAARAERAAAADAYERRQRAPEARDGEGAEEDSARLEAIEGAVWAAEGRTPLPSAAATLRLVTGALLAMAADGAGRALWTPAPGEEARVGAGGPAGLATFLLDFFLPAWGHFDAARERALELLAAARRHAASHPRLAAFARLAGVDPAGRPPPGPEALAAYLAAVPALAGPFCRPLLPPAPTEPATEPASPRVPVEEAEGLWRRLFGLHAAPALHARLARPPAPQGSPAAPRGPSPATPAEAEAAAGDEGPEVDALLAAVAAEAAARADAARGRLAAAFAPAAGEAAPGAVLGFADFAARLRSAEPRLPATAAAAAYRELLARSPAGPADRLEPAACIAAAGPACLARAALDPPPALRAGGPRGAAEEAGLDAAALAVLGDGLERVLAPRLAAALGAMVGSRRALEAGPALEEAREGVRGALAAGSGEVAALHFRELARELAPAAPPL